MDLEQQQKIDDIEEAKTELARGTEMEDWFRSPAGERLWNVLMEHYHLHLVAVINGLPNKAALKEIETLASYMGRTIHLKEESRRRLELLLSGGDNV